MPLDQIQDSDRPGYVIADSFTHALEKYNRAVAAENDGNSDPPPQGVIRICDDTELIVDEGWKS